MQRTPQKRPPGTDRSDKDDDIPLAQLVNRSKETLVQNPTPFADHSSESTPSQDGLADLRAAMTLLLQLQREQIARSTLPVTTTVQQPSDPLRLRIDVPKYASYSDSQSVTTFIDSLRDYQAVSGITDEMVLTRLLSSALTWSAAMWRRQQPYFGSLDDFVTRFRSEFLPADYVMRLKDQPRACTQHPDESLIEFVRALQRLYDLADQAATDSEKVVWAVHQSHPRFHVDLRERNFRILDEIAQAAVTIQADILVELWYQHPPPRSAALEPVYAWAAETL